MSNSDHAWVAACGGTEKAFMYKGKKYLYMWNWATSEHSYYCISDDVFISDLFL